MGARPEKKEEKSERNSFASAGCQNNNIFVVSAVVAVVVVAVTRGYHQWQTAIGSYLELKELGRSWKKCKYLREAWGN